MKTNKKGISLIVLVITIIVMIILAAAIIITLANNGIIGRANDAVEDMTEAQIREAAQLAWADLYLGGGQITGELIKQHLEASGISKAELDKYKITADENGVTVELIGNSKPSGELNENGFYYNMLYTGTRTSYDETFNIGIVFFENDKAIGFIKVNDFSKIMNIGVTVAPDKYVIMPDAGVMTVTYEDSTVISLDPSTGDEIGKITFSENGTKATVETDATGLLPTGTVLTLDENQGTAHGMYFGAEYYVEGVVDGNAVSIPTIFYEDGSAKVDFVVETILAPAGTFEWLMDNYVALVEDEPAVLVAFDGNIIYSMEVDGTSLRIQVGVRKSTGTSNNVTHSGTIPEGGKYYVGVPSTTVGNQTTTTAVGNYDGATATLTAGQQFPETVNVGDVYVYGEYEYRYNFSTLAFAGQEAYIGADIGGWTAKVLDKGQSSYKKALDTINGKAVVDMGATYAYCENLVKAPQIPESVTQMNYTFGACKNLNTYEGSTALAGDFSGYVIPSNVTSLNSAFVGCEMMTKSPDISGLTKLTDLNSTFANCTNLIDVSVLPSSVKTMMHTFSHCTNLSSLPIISHLTELYNIDYAFSECKELKTYHGRTSADGDFSGYILPAGITTMEYAFFDCAAMTKAPDLSRATKLNIVSGAFNRCTMLTGTIEINANPGAYSTFLFKTQISAIEGSTTLKTELMATK